MMVEEDVCELDFTPGPIIDSTSTHNRVIIHIDIDCFYAQVETILNPSLVGKPLGIQQKNLVVTCNYEARRLGVKKLMSVKTAKDICPTLILVNGEDLKKYREMSEKIYQVLQNFSLHIEKLGLDENFIDVTSSVAASKTEHVNVQGHIYNNAEEMCVCGCKERLCRGSIIASEIRAQLKSELNISACAGIAHNKLLAKLAGAIHKPNQQTLLFPSAALSLLSTLSSPRGLPGIGSSTYKKLASLGIDTIDKLQMADKKDLTKAFGIKLATQIQQLSFGIDETSVKVTDKPKSIGAEDGFPVVRIEAEIQEKLANLLDRVLDLVRRDGRKPTNVKLTVRKMMCVPEKHNIRETRQTPVNIDVTHLDTCGKTKIIQTLMSLFMKIVGSETGWLVNLLGISFSGFPSDCSTAKNSIFKYFNANKSPEKRIEMKRILATSQDAQDAATQQPPIKRIRVDESVLQELPPELRMEILSDIDSYGPGTSETKLNDFVTVDCPNGIDPTVYSQLPPEIQKELLQESRKKIKVSNDKKPKNLLSYFRKV